MTIFSALIRGIHHFSGWKLKLNLLSIFAGIFPSSPGYIFFRITCKISALTDERFLSYDHLKQLKKGYFCCFLWWQFKINFLRIFVRIFSVKPKNHFFGIPQQISALTDRLFLVMAILSSPKRGISTVFWGENWNSTFWASFLEFFSSSTRTNFYRITRKIATRTLKRFFNYGYFKRPKKRYFAIFLGENWK